MAKAKIIGTGLYAPGKAIGNEEVQKLAGVEFDSEKIVEKLGIEERHIARLRGIDETSADFATKAAEAAIKDAGIDPDEIAIFTVGSDTPEYISPSTAVLVQGRIQGKKLYTGSFDINASCASFTIALDMVAAKVAADKSIKYAVVVGVYNMPAFFNDGDAFAYSIFADGAGAVVLERTDDNDESGYINGLQITEGTEWDYIGIYTGGSRQPATHQRINNKEIGLQLLKPLPGSRNVELWPPIANKLFEKAELSVDDIDHILFTQINKSVITEVMDILKLPMEKTTTVMDKYGYTGSGCIPMALHHAVKDGKIKKGDTVAFIASGAGLSVGCNILKF